MTQCHKEDCVKAGSLRCSQCKQANYCSKECQRADWKKHKKQCRTLNGDGRDGKRSEQHEHTVAVAGGASGSARSRRTNTAPVTDDHNRIQQGPKPDYNKIYRNDPMMQDFT